MREQISNVRVRPVRAYFGADYTPATKQRLDFSNAQNPLGAGQLARAAIQTQAQHISAYPALYADDLSAKLAQMYAPLEVLCTAGAGAGVLLAAQAFIKAGQNVVLPALSFPIIINGATIMGGEAINVPMHADHSVDLEGLAAHVNAKTGMVFLCNPNNPTGELLAADDIFALCRAVDVPVVVSEANIEYAGQSLLAAGAVMPRNLVVLRSFSKIHGLAALRVGYMVAHAEMTARLREVLCPFTVNALGQAAALAALNDTSHVTTSRTFMATQRAALHEGLSGMGLHVCPSAGNTLFFEVPANFMDAHAFARALEAHDCSVVDGGHFSPATRRYVRIAPRTAADNQAFLNIVAQLGEMA